MCANSKSLQPTMINENFIRNATSGKCVIKMAQTSSNVSSCLDPSRCDKEPRVVASQEVWPTIRLLVCYFNSYNLIKQCQDSQSCLMCKTIKF
jgi:hypothetical protein